MSLMRRVHMLPILRRLCLAVHTAGNEKTATMHRSQDTFPRQRAGECDGNVVGATATPTTEGQITHRMSTDFT